MDSLGRPLPLHRAMFFQAILDAWNTHLSSVNISNLPLATAASRTCGKCLWQNCLQDPHDSSQ